MALLLIPLDILLIVLLWHALPWIAIGALSLLLLWLLFVVVRAAVRLGVEEGMKR